MSEDRLDPRLARLAGSYNPPPPTPREAIWREIRVALDARVRTRRGGPRRGHPGRGRPRRVLLAAVATGMAAGFVVGLLVGGVLPGGPGGAEPAWQGAAAGLVDPRTGDHLARVDLLLRAIRADVQAGSVPAGTPEAARVLLADNRLLADIPPDVHLPEVAQLLDDIELVLAQIAVLEGPADPEELRLLDEGIETREVMPRLYRLAANR